MSENIEKFIGRVNEAVENGTFVRMTLSKPALKADDLRNVYIRPILIKNSMCYSFTYRYLRRDEVKNYTFEQMRDMLGDMIPLRFQNAVLFTVSEDITLLVGKKQTSTIQIKKAGECRECNLEHDNVKNRLVNPSNEVWHQLGIATRDGRVLADMQHKYKQICRYTEIVGSLLGKEKSGRELRIVDMGAGKGYLTFALHEYLTNKLGLAVDMKGVEIRKDIVLTVNDIIRKCNLSGIEFVEGAINNYPVEGIDVLIALHACDTATDDAIAAGIRAGAEYIICAPCCHKQIRREMEKSGKTDSITRYGIFLERQAVMITDTIRALVLEYFGYKTQVMEFIDMEHTPKNVLLVGRKTESKPDCDDIVAQINRLKSEYGIGKAHIETLLKIK